MYPSMAVGGMYNDCFARGKMWYLPSTPEHAMLLIIHSVSRHALCPMQNYRIVAVGKSGREARSSVLIQGNRSVRRMFTESVKAVTGFLKAALMPSN